MIRWLDRIALAATLLLPVFLMHGRAIAEVLIAIVDGLFLLRCAIARDWRWLRQVWVGVAALFWIWLMICSLPGIGSGSALSWGGAAAYARVLLLPAALQSAVLATPSARLWFWRVLAASAAYIGLQTVLQFATGRDIQGFRRWVDGALTGPFYHPRAAAPLARLMFPTLLPLLGGLLSRRRWLPTLAATVVAALALGLLVLIGQRMPLLIAVLGMVVAGFLLPRLRGPLVAAIALGGILIAASAVVSPPAFYRLVTRFSSQMEHFPDSEYGRIYIRALVIASDHPLTGRGFDGFRDTCADPATFRRLPWLGQTTPDGGGMSACNIHPHNFYLEALTEAGVPGLVLFGALAWTWMAAAGRGLLRHPDPLRVGLFVAVSIHLWPIASTGGFTALDLDGFFFVILGLALAEAPAPAPWRRVRLHDAATSYPLSLAALPP